MKNKVIHFLAAATIFIGSCYIFTIELWSAFEKATAGIIFVISNGYLLYWTNYMQKKGDNAATKEDIQEITKLTEYIKHELDLARENKISFQSLRRDAIINCYEKYIRWLNYVMFLTFDIAPSNVVQELDAFASEYTNSESKLRLFDSHFEDYEAEINRIKMLTMNIHVNYILTRNRILSIVSTFPDLEPHIPLIQQEKDNFNNLRQSNYQKIESNLAALTVTLRGLIQNNLLM